MQLVWGGEVESSKDLKAFPHSFEISGLRPMPQARSQLQGAVCEVGGCRGAVANCGLQGGMAAMLQVARLQGAGLQALR